MLMPLQLTLHTGNLLQNRCTMTQKRLRDYGEGHNIDDTSDDGDGDGDGALATDGRHSLKTGPQSLDQDRTPSTSTSTNIQGHDAGSSSTSSWPVVLYAPNILGYLRILLSFHGFRHALHKQPNKALNIWVAAAVLDLFDGIAARRLNQCSQFGILLDIVADNILRSIAWISAIIEYHRSSLSSGGGINEMVVCVWVGIIFLEWITMFCTQQQQSNNMQTDQSDEQNVHWKDVKRKSPSKEIEKNNSKAKVPPFWVQAVFRNNFRSPAGILAIFGLFVAPFGSYVWYADHVQQTTWPFRILSEQHISNLIMISCVGRFLSFMVELWLCKEYLSGVIANDTRKRVKPKDS